MKKSILSVICLVAVISLSFISCGDKKAKTSNGVQSNQSSAKKAKIAPSEEVKAVFAMFDKVGIKQLVEADVEDGDYFPNGGSKKLLLNSENCTVTFEGKTYYAKDFEPSFGIISLCKSNGEAYAELAVKFSNKKKTDYEGMCFIVGEKRDFFAKPE